MKPRLLYIDDSQDHLETLSEILSTCFQVETSNGGEDLNAQIDGKVFDVVLLDIHMPGEDGYAIYQKIKKQKTMQETPVLFISSDDSINTKIAALGLGAQDYIDRSMSPDELIIRLKNKVLNKQAMITPPPPNISFHGLVFDTQAMKFYLDGQYLELTLSEMHILSFLIQSPNKESKQKAILEEALEGRTMTEQTLRVHTSNIRRKLAPGGLTISNYKGTYRLEVVPQ